MAAHGVAQEHRPPRLPHRDRLPTSTRCPTSYIGKEVDVRLRGQVIDVFHRGPARSRAICAAIGQSAARPPSKEHQPAKAHQRAGVEDTRVQAGAETRATSGSHVLAYRGRDHGAADPNPEFGFRCLLRRPPAGQRPRAGPLRRRLPLRAWSSARASYRGLDNILRTGADLAQTPSRSPRPCADRSFQHQRTGVLSMTDKNGMSHPLGRADRLIAPARHARRLPRTDGAQRPRRHALRGPPGAVDRPRDRRAALAAPCSAASRRPSSATPDACFEDINLSRPRGLDRSVVLGLADCAWVRNGANILITGPCDPGS